MFCTGRRSARRDFRSITHRIAIPMKARSQWTHSDIWSPFATTPELLFSIGDRQHEKKWWNSNQRAIWIATRWIDPGHGVFCHWGVSHGTDGVCPLRRSHSAQTKIFFADVILYSYNQSTIQCPHCDSLPLLSVGQTSDRFRNPPEIGPWGAVQW
jgi:hypothetical protein